MKDILDYSKMVFEEPYTRGQFNRRNWIEQRKAIMAEVMASDPGNRWTYEQLSNAMKSNPLVARYQPAYSIMTARRDFLALKDELKERRGELAGEYIATQLEIADDIIQDLWQDYQELNKVNPQDLVPDHRAQYLKDRIEKKDQITRAIERMFKRQAALIPDLEAPKQVQVSSISVTMTNDEFLELKKRALQPPDDEDIIDGEVIGG